MKNIFALCLVSLLASCGNPHVSSSKGGLERTRSPIEQEEVCESPNVEVSDYTFITGTEASKDYNNFVKCRNVTREDFNIFTDGIVTELSNNGRSEIPYLLTHRSEIQHDPNKVVHLEEIFGNTTYEFSVQNPVTNSSSTGVDRGVNSGSVDVTSQDALVWKLSAPVSFWSARTVGLKKDSTLRIFNCSEELLNEVDVKAKTTFVGFISAFENVCNVSLSAAEGEDSVAVDGFEYGR